jgi:hypothetical protein
MTALPLPGWCSRTNTQYGLTEQEHHAFGARLKQVEAIATAYRYTRYRKNSKIGKRLDRLIKAARDLRPILDNELAYVRGQNEGNRNWRQYHGSDAYFGPEVSAMQIATFLLDCPRMRGEPAPVEPDEFIRDVENLLTVGQRHPPRLPWHTPPAVLMAADSEPTPSARTDRHAAVRAGLLEDPDRPQATFVKLCRVHPDTVRRCRRQLEEAGAIPYLAHRHGPAQAKRRKLEVAEAAE